MPGVFTFATFKAVSRPTKCAMSLPSYPQRYPHVARIYPRFRANARGREYASNAKNMAIFPGVERRPRTKANIGVAEREGFEPPIGLHLCRISSAVHSTTLPPLQSAKSRPKPTRSGRVLGEDGEPDKAPAARFSQDAAANTDRPPDQCPISVLGECRRGQKSGGTAIRDKHWRSRAASLKCRPEKLGLRLSAGGSERKVASASTRAT